MKKILVLGLLLAGLIIISCAPASTEEFSGEGELALAGEAISLGCTTFTRGITSCTQNADGSISVMSRGRSRPSTLVDKCGNSEVVNDFSCIKTTGYRLCRTQCESNEDCVNAQCIPRCGNGIVNSREDCSTCPADVRCVEGYSCEEGVCRGRCTPESTFVTLNGSQPLSTVKPLLTAADLPGLLRSSTVDATGTSNTEQQLSFTNRNSEFINPLSNRFIIANGDQIAKYELFFDPPWSSAPNLSDFVRDQLQILGKEYLILRAYHPPAAPELGIILWLMSGEVRDTLLEDESEMYITNGREYVTTLTFMDADECKFDVNGEATNKLKVGDTYILADGIEIGVSDLLYQNYSGGIHSCTFFLGAERIVLRDDLITDEQGAFSIKVGAEDIDGTNIIIEGSTDETIYSISKITVQMTAEDDYRLGSNELLSETIREAGEEPEVLFTSNWDMRFEGYDVASNSGVVEIGRICPR